MGLGVMAVIAVVIGCLFLGGLRSMASTSDGTGDLGGGPDWDGGPGGGGGNGGGD